MIRHLFSCFSIMASHSGTCVMIPGWNGPKSPCGAAQMQANNQTPNCESIVRFVSSRYTTVLHPNEVEHAAIVLEVEMRQNTNELLLSLLLDTHGRTSQYITYWRDGRLRNRTRNSVSLALRQLTGAAMFPPA